MFTLITNGQVYDPAPVGEQDILLAHDRIAIIGNVSLPAIENLGLDIDVIDASGCYVTPGLIDPHQHLLGGSGEAGFGSQTPPVSFQEIISAGITTVVGCLGADSTTKTMAGLLAKAKALREAGVSAFIYSGGYHLPPATITTSVQQDLLFISEVIGVGEIAIADERAAEPTAAALSKVVHDCHTGGLLSRKAGVTHLHVGEGQRRLALVRELLGSYDVRPEWVYPTHVQRSELLLKEAVELTRSGVTVDLDTVDQDLLEQLNKFHQHGGEMSHVTASSDAAINSPRTLYEQIRVCLVNRCFPIERVLQTVTLNTARVLKLPGKGRLTVHADADLVVWRQDTFDLVHVIAGGRCLVRNGAVAATESFLEASNRHINLVGKAPHQSAFAS